MKLGRDLLVLTMALPSFFLGGAASAVGTQASSAVHPGTWSAADSLRIAYVELAVQSTAGSATTATAVARTRLRTVVGEIQGSGIEIRDLWVGEVQLDPILEATTVPVGRRLPSPPRVRGYHAWVPITVVTPALGRIDVLIDHAAGMGAAFQGLAYETVPIEKPERKKVRERERERARPSPPGAPR